MAITILNKVPYEGETGVLPYRPTKFSVLGDTGLTQSTLNVWFGYSTWLYSPSGPTVLPETFVDPLVVDRLNWAGADAGTEPTILVAGGYLSILQTALNQKGVYHVWTPVLSPAHPQSIVRATVKWTPGAVLTSSAAGLFSVGPSGHKAGVLVVDSTHANIYGAPTAPVLHNWAVAATFTLLWDDDQKVFYVWKDDDLTPVWEIPYAALTIHASDPGYVSVIFGNDGLIGSTFFIKDLYYIAEANSVVSNGVTTSLYSQSLIPNTISEVEGNLLPPYDKYPWVESAGSTATKEILNGDILKLTSGDSLDSIYFRRTDPRMDGSFVSRFQMKVAATIDPTVSFSSHAGVRVQGDRDIRLAFLEENGAYYVGILLAGGSYLDINDYQTYEYDWRVETWYTLVYVACLGVVYAFLDETDAPILTVPIGDIGPGPATTPTFDVGILNSGVDTTLELRNFLLVPALDQFHALGGMGSWGQCCFQPGGPGEPTWDATGWFLPFMGVSYTVVLSVGTSSPYVESCCYFDDTKEINPGAYFGASDSTYAYLLKPYYSKHGKVMYLSSATDSTLLTEIDGQSNVGAARSFGVNWDEPHIYRMMVRQGERIQVFLDTVVDPVIDLAWTTDLPVAISTVGMFSGGTVASYWRFYRVGMASGWDLNFKKNFGEDEDEVVLAQAGVQVMKVVEVFP
jgi:hypothetical protein